MSQSVQDQDLFMFHDVTYITETRLVEVNRLMIRACGQHNISFNFLINLCSALQIFK